MVLEGLGGSWARLGGVLGGLGGVLGGLGGGLGEQGATRQKKGRKRGGGKPPKGGGLGGHLEAKVAPVREKSRERKQTREETGKSENRAPVEAGSSFLRFWSLGRGVFWS